MRHELDLHSALIAGVVIGILWPLLTYVILVGTKLMSEPETARHEAGHVVAHFVGFGKAPYRVALTTFQLSNTMGRTTNCSGDDCRGNISVAEQWHTLVLLLAGMAAASSRDGGDNDIRTFRDVVLVLLDEQQSGQDISPPWPNDLSLRQFDFTDISEEAWRRTTEVVAQHRPQIDALAEALLRRGSLEHEEIEAIIDATGK